MSFNEKNIYELLPAIYRIRDAEQGGQLKALMDIVAKQALVMQNNIDELYDNWFIETCKDWVIPYIGDLLGVQAFHNISGAAVSQRSYVANTIRYRRRKGIAPVLEQLTLDITGWRAHVKEFFQLLQTTQYMNHIRPQRTIAPDLRQMNTLDLLDTPFDAIAHSADVRHISSGRGKYNIPNIGLFVWRLQNYPMVKGAAFLTTCVQTSPPSSPAGDVKNIFTFSPMGNNMQLFNNPVTETKITHISTELNVPCLLKRRALHDELEARRKAVLSSEGIVYGFFNDSSDAADNPASRKHPVFEIFKIQPDDEDEKGQLVPPEEILICNLATCCIPPTEVTYEIPDGTGHFVTKTSPITVAVDPVLGRFIFVDQAIKKARVSYSYGFSGNLGGGPYNRQSSVDAFLKVGEEKPLVVTWQAGVGESVVANGDTLFTTLQPAIDKWNSLDPGAIGVITIMDNRSYNDTLPIVIKERSQLLIVAADWPGDNHIKGEMSAEDRRPHIAAGITIKGTTTSAPGEETGGNVAFNGLLIEGKITVQEGCLGKLQIVHSTVVPGKGGLQVLAGNAPDMSNEWLNIEMDHAICSTVDLKNVIINSFTANDSIINKEPVTDYAIDAAGTPVSLRNVTAFGSVLARTIEADNSILNNPVIAVRRQTGCMRFCYVPPEGSQTPRKYRCQPDLEISTATETAAKTTVLGDADKALIKQKVISWLVPAYTSTEYTHHGYAQLNVNCPEQIAKGASNASEMGAFNFLQQPQRRTNLQIALDEYLLLGLEAGVFYTT